VDLLRRDSPGLFARSTTHGHKRSPYVIHTFCSCVWRNVRKAADQVQLSPQSTTAILRVAACTPVMVLLNGVQSLIDEHAHQHQQQHARTGAEDPDRLREPVDFHQQFSLLLLHVRVRIVEI